MSARDFYAYWTLGGHSARIKMAIEADSLDEAYALANTYETFQKFGRLICVDPADDE